MKHIGMVVAVEMSAVKRKYGEPQEVQSVHNYNVMIYKADNYQLYIIHSRAGEIAAAAATQLLICEFNVDVIVNFGVVGGLTDGISNTRVCVVKSVVHYGFDISEVEDCEPGRYLYYPSVYIPVDEKLLKLAKEKVPSLKEVVCASGDKFIGSEQKKRELSKQFHADICEMEAAGIVLTCNRNNVPCLLIKMVSDGVSGGVNEFRTKFEQASDECIEILDLILHTY